MNPTTESRLWIEAHQGNSAAVSEIILEHRRIVFKLAMRHRPNDQDELIGEGEVALCEAAATYPEKDRACRFSTYAHIRVNAQMIKFMRVDFQWTRTEWEGRKTHESKRLIESEVEKRRSEGKPPPTIVELADVCGQDAVDRWLDTKNAVGVEYLHTAPVNGHRVDERRLPKPTQLVMQALSEGASVGEIAMEWKQPRQEIEQRAVHGWNTVYDPNRDGIDHEQAASQTRSCSPR